MRWRACFGVAAVLGSAACPMPAAAAGGEYHVLKCHVLSRSAAEVETEAASPYSPADRCDSPDQRLEITNSGQGLPGQAGLMRFTAPSGTAIVGINLQANLRRDNHHFAQLAVVDFSGSARALAQGSDQATGLEDYSFTGLNDLRFVVQLFCSDPGGCPPSSQAHAYARNIDLVLADRVDPGVTRVSGGLTEPGWLRETQTLQVNAGDDGSGLASLVASAGGVEIGWAGGDCSSVGAPRYTGVLVPCPELPAGVTWTATIDTRVPPFANGANFVELCPEDFAGNRACETFTARVDNEPPHLFFSEHQDPADPELIQVAATDKYSGIAVESAVIMYRAVGASEWTTLPTRVSSGEILARVDSGSVPSGAYEFIATTTDVAGNAAQTSTRSDGMPMILTFPLREAVQLVSRIGGSRSETIGYGHDSQASGRLLDSSGEPMADREITVTEYFGVGALIDQRVRAVTTNQHGRWSSKLPAGPSREVSVTFAGTPALQPAESGLGELRVRSRASLETSTDRVREGRRVVFAGKVGHFGARIPSGGKLVELQVKERAGRWNTVREAFHTDASGRFRLGYRFGRFYETNANFVFRIKIAREQGWPYRAPGRSRSRTVTVVAR